MLLEHQPVTISATVCVRDGWYSHMSKVMRPSREQVQEAWKLGRQMAVYDRQTRPNLTNAHHYPSYPMFQTAHRHRIEQSPAFRPWDTKLHRIVEQAAKCCRLSPNDPQQWDQFYSGVGRMIHAVFWSAWEQAYQIEPRYCHLMAEHQSTDRPAVLRVAHRTPPDVDAQAEQDKAAGDLWDNVADKVFDEMKTDEDAQFWKLPTAESMGAKTSPTL